MLYGKYSVVLRHFKVRYVPWAEIDTFVVFYPCTAMDTTSDRIRRAQRFSKLTVCCSKKITHLYPSLTLIAFDKILLRVSTLLA